MSQSELCQDMSLRSVHSLKKADARTDKRKEVLFSLKEEAILLYNIVHQLVAGFESSLQMIARIWEAIKRLIAELDDLIFTDADQQNSAHWSTDPDSPYPTLTNLQNKLRRVKRKLFQELPLAYEVIFPKANE